VEVGKEAVKKSKVKNQKVKVKKLQNFEFCLLSFNLKKEA